MFIAHMGTSECNHSTLGSESVSHLTVGNKSVVEFIKISSLA